MNYLQFKNHIPDMVYAKEFAVPTWLASWLIIKILHDFLRLNFPVVASFIWSVCVLYSGNWDLARRTKSLVAALMFKHSNILKYNEKGFPICFSWLYYESFKSKYFSHLNINLLILYSAHFRYIVECKINC